MTNAMNTGIYGRVNPGPGFGDEYSYTDDAVLTAAQDGAAINNAGAAKAIELTLPQAFAGMEYAINRIAAFSIGVKPNPVDSIGGSSPGVTKRLFARGLTTFACFVDGTWETVIKADSGDRAINVLDYGVLADGVSDDGPAINAANDAAYAAKLPVFYPTGVYGVLTPVVIKAPMICAGGNSPRMYSNIPLYGTRFLNLGITGTTASIAGITLGATTTITTTAAHGFATGTLVKISGITGTTQLNGVYHEIVSTGPTTFTLTDVDSTGYTAWGAGGTVTSMPAVLKVNSDLAAQEVARGFRVDGGFAVDGSGYTCTGFHAPGKDGTNYLTRFRLQNLHATGCTVGISISGFTGSIEQCYSTDNTDSQLLMRVCNSVNVTGGEYAPTDSTDSWGVKVYRSGQVNFMGVNIQGDVGKKGNGLDIGEGCTSVTVQSYLENMAGDATNVGYHLRVGATNKYGGDTPANSLGQSVRNFTLISPLSSASAATATVYNSLGPKIYMGNVLGADIGMLYMSTKDLEISAFARDITGGMVGTYGLAAASPGVNGFEATSYTTDSSNKMGRPALSMIPTLDFRGSAGGAVRGFKEVVLSANITVALETTITRNGVSSLKITRAGAALNGYERCVLFPFNQSSLSATAGSKQVLVTGWMYVPSGAPGAPNECYSLAGSSNIRYPSFGWDIDVGAGRTSQGRAMGFSGGAIHIGYYGLNKWTRFFGFASLTAVVDFGIAIWPLNAQAADTGGGPQDHSVYISDLAMFVNPQSWTSALGGSFSLDSRSGLFIGDQFIVSASAPPTHANTYWAKGDTVLNSAPAVGSPDRWVCTTAGTGATAVFTPTANL